MSEEEIRELARPETPGRGLERARRPESEASAREARNSRAGNRERAATHERPESTLFPH